IWRLAEPCAWIRSRRPTSPATPRRRATTTSSGTTRLVNATYWPSHALALGLCDFTAMRVLAEGSFMNVLMLASNISLWVLLLSLAFLLLGALRALGLLRWRLDQLEATTPSRLGRGGLKQGKKAPEFTLPSVAGGEVSLHDFAGRKVLLVFTQSGCGPCHRILPELNKLQRGGAVQVLVVNNGEGEAARQAAREARAPLPVLAQEQFSVSKGYEAFATPFAFLIDELGVIASKGIVNSGQQIGFVLAGARDPEKNGHPEAEPAKAAAGVS